MTATESILLYVRPWNFTQLEDLACRVWGAEATLKLASEHQTVDASGLVAAFNAAYRKMDANTKLRHLTEDEAADMILRCRLLRSVAAGRAKRLLVAMEHAVDKVLRETQPTAMLSLTIDSYVMDLFYALCVKRGIRFIGLVPSFLNNQFRITARGEHIDCRQVTDAEIETALTALIVKDYRPDFLVQSNHEMRRQMWRLWSRNLLKPLWFALNRMKPGEAKNYHYWASQIIAMKFWSPWPPQLNGASGPRLAAVADDGGLPLIYLPLQMSPEATVDYWSCDTRWIDYEQYIIELVRHYQGKWRFLVKEHPNLLGYRSRGFYRRLEAEQNCVMVSPEVPSNDLVVLCQGVLVCTGTAGFEAALRGKPVFSDSAPYYAPKGALLSINSLAGELSNWVNDTISQRNLMAHMMCGTLEGRFLNNGTWSADNPEHRKWSATMAASIRDYLEREKMHKTVDQPKINQQTSSQ